MAEKSKKRVAAGKKSRRKGASNENKLAKQFKEWWGKGEWARTPSSGGWATKDTREGFRTCGDLICSDHDFPMCIEAKKQEGWNLEQLLLNEKCVIWDWWNQAVEETPEGMVPMLVFARNFIKPLVMLQFDLVDSPVKDILEELEKLRIKRITVRCPVGSIVAIFPLDGLFSVDADVVRRACLK